MLRYTDHVNGSTFELPDTFAAGTAERDARRIEIATTRKPPARPEPLARIGPGDDADEVHDLDLSPLELIALAIVAAVAVAASFLWS